MSHRTARAALLLAITAALAAPSLASATSFTRTDVTTGDLGAAGVSESSAATADFTGDGRPDLVIGGQYSSLGPRLLRNNGSGGFASPGTTIPTGYDTGALAPVDLDGDGKMDLITGTDIGITALKGNGDGTFSVKGTYSVFQGGQTDLQIADVNNDGKPDVVVLLRYGVKTFFGTGTGTLTSGPTSYIPSPFMSGIDAANFNNDGKVDLVAADAATAKVYRLLGNGDGTFTLSGTGNTQLVPGTVLAGDFNGDGISDVIATAEASPGNNASVLISTPGGGFASPVLYNAGLAPVSGATGDINGDGHLDVVSADTIGSAIYVLYGNPDGTFSSAVPSAVATYPQTPVIADFDGDGRNDIAVPGSANAFGAGQITVSVLHNNG